MKHVNFFLAKFPAVSIFFIIFLSASSAESQIALTRALDYDGDGKVDRTIFKPADNSWYITKSATGITISVQWGAVASDTLIPGDYDGDGKGDIAVWRESEGAYYYLKSSNGGVVSGYWGQAGDEPVCRDYDGDGKTDIAVVRRENGVLNWYILQSSNNAFLGMTFGFNTDRPAPGDFDGDGRFDFAVQRRRIDNFVSFLDFYISSSKTGAVSGFTWGKPSDIFLPGDYDGDGKTDIAVGRDQRGNIREYIDSSGAILGNSPLEWHILRSSDNGYQGLVVGDLDEGDFPVQGDYDGDGKCDAAVWRNTSGYFYVQQTLFNTTINYAPNQYYIGALPIAAYDFH